jgi:hypothetical protein
MTARDNAASVQGDAIRITPLNIDGTINASKPILTTDGFISASFGTEFEDGDEISEKAANGKVCIQYKADDSMTGITFNLSLCSPDPEAAAVLAGGDVIMSSASGPVVGYSSPGVGDLVGNPVAIEIWSKAIINGKPASGDPYWAWVFPYVRVRYDGDREFTNGALANEFSGTGVGNDALVAAGLNPVRPTDTFVVYRGALTNPFSYVRAASLPTLGWSTVAWSGGGIGPSGTTIAATLATGATAGTPGSFTGGAVPANLAALTGAAPAIVASPTSAWTGTQYVVLGDGSHAFWNATAWTAGH